MMTVKELRATLEAVDFYQKQHLALTKKVSQHIRDLMRAKECKSDREFRIIATLSADDLFNHIQTRPRYEEAQK